MFFHMFYTMASALYILLKNSFFHNTFLSFTSIMLWMYDSVCANKAGKILIERLPNIFKAAVGRNFKYFEMSFWKSSDLSLIWKRKISSFILNLWSLFLSHLFLCQEHWVSWLSVISLHNVSHVLIFWMLSAGKQHLLCLSYCHHLTENLCVSCKC